MQFEAKLETWDDDFGIRITKRLAKKLQVTAGDKLQVRMQKLSNSSRGFGILQGAPVFKRDLYDFTDR